MLSKNYFLTKQDQEGLNAAADRSTTYVECEESKMKRASDEVKMKQVFEAETRERMNTLKTKAIEKIYYDAILMKYKTIIDSSEELADTMLVEAREAIKYSIKLQKMKVTSEYYFVIVSPKQGITLEQLQKKVEKYINRSIIIGTMYTYEWTKEKQVHVHIIVHQMECSDRDFRKNTKNSFKQLVGNLACVDVRAIPEDWLDDKKAYILGEKWDEGKDDMIAFDK